MKYYVKQIGLPLIYLVCFAVVGYSLTIIGVMWLQIAISAFLAFAYCFLMVLLFLTEGKTARKTLHANDLERMQLIKTGSCGEIKEHEEYKPWKGFFIGFCLSIPLILLALIHLIVMLVTNGANPSVAVIAQSLYMPFYGVIAYTCGALEGWLFFYLLLCIPLICVVCGVPYIIGAKKIQKQYDKVQEMHEQIYGENKDCE